MFVVSKLIDVGRCLLQCSDHQHAMNFCLRFKLHDDWSLEGDLFSNQTGPIQNAVEREAVETLGKSVKSQGEQETCKG